MTYDDFASQVRDAKLYPRDCGNGHWQIVGGKKLVNFWSDTKRGIRIYVAGAKHGATVDSVADAIACAGKPQPVSPSIAAAVIVAGYSDYEPVHFLDEVPISD